MVRTLPLKRQAARLSLISVSGLLAICGALWYSGQLRLIEQVTAPTGATILRVTGVFGSEDEYFDPGSKWGHGRGGVFARTIKEQGTRYHWRLSLG